MKRPSPRFIAELATNLILPWAAYTLAHPHWGDSGGLLASAAPPLAWSVWELARFRKLDVLSLFVLAGIALSLLALVLGGDARLLLIRESMISGLIGLIFLVSLTSQKPLIYHLARAAQNRRSGAQQESQDVLWQDGAIRTALRLMTLVWGLALSGEALLRIWLAWQWPVERFLIVTPLISYGLIGAIALWSFWFGRRIAATRSRDASSTEA